VNKYVLNRVEAIRQTMRTHRQAGAGLPSAVIGSERELFVTEFLSKVLPPTLRVGRGCVTDVAGKLTGQLEVVIEYPFVPSFPMPSTSERLYLAESVALVIEVKSHLSNQWAEVRKTVSEVKPLRRELRQPELFALQNSPDSALVPDRSRVYCYAVGYEGHKRVQSLRELLDKTPADEKPDGALVIDSGCYVGVVGEADKAWGLYAFLTEMTTITNAVLGIANPVITGYGKIRPRGRQP
jgi:hypothetical protein